MNIISQMIFVLMVFLSAEAYGQSMTVQLAPQESKTISNHYLWTLNANCTIQSKPAGQLKNKILIRVVKLNGKVNGRTLKTGQTTAVLVKNHDNVSVSADAGAEVNLQNLSHDKIKASCSA